ncbi:MAG: ECF transporter S component [Clostridia bacterium]|nr:ECF transporter S component [Clostridia bacterium]
MANNNRAKLIKLVQIALVTAIVVLLQLLGAVIRFSTFSISLVLVPIVIGAVLYGPVAGAWFGLVFGVTVLLSGDAAAFYAFSPAGTIFIVLLKGTLAGLASGLVFKPFSNNKNKYPGVFLAALTCPVVNTGVFLIGCLTVFRNYLQNFSEDTITNPLIFVITVFIGFNFVFELLLNIILSPAIYRITELGKKYLSRK